MPVSLLAAAPYRALGAPLRALVALVLAREGRRAGEIAIALEDDARLRALNRRWRGIDRATDVLSFGDDAGDARSATRPVRGDLAISLERMREQARRYRVTPGRELARLVVHGTLHLAGHDHARAAERQRMRARENAALRAARPLVSRIDAGLRRA